MNHWQIWIDTGGTFTDCIARDPQGRFHKTKVLSSSALRGEVADWGDGQTLRLTDPWNLPADFFKGFTFRLLNRSHAPLRVTAYDFPQSTLSLSEPIAPHLRIPGESFQISSEMEAPVLAARLVTRTPPGTRLPKADLRLATTRGTNALLENRGAPSLLLVTEGFRDLLEIGSQKRADLFGLELHKPEPLYQKVVEVPERIGANGEVVRALDRDLLNRRLDRADLGAITSAAICLMNSYRNSDHEHRVRELLQERGIRFLSASSDLSSAIKILPRTQTALINASLDPIFREYIGQVEENRSGGRFRMMTSAGGLVSGEQFKPKDSLLSGPAGGVVGAARAGKEAGFDHIISFDMGGTSTDVARFDDAFDYQYSHRVGDAELAAPALAIETVAAGGGSICSFDGFKLSVGPESAGADPGPACYGAGGPLTVTDVNLLLGRLDPENFGIPVALEDARERLREIMDEIKESDHLADTTERELLEGYLQIANERMADAIRKISLRQGYDPRDYAIVAFGGAGGQHACALAGQLEADHVVIPDDAGLLSAYGLGHAVIEEIAERQLLEPLSALENTLESKFRALATEAAEMVRGQGVAENDIAIRRQTASLRLEGQDTSLEIPFHSFSKLKKHFEKRYRDRYGHWLADRTVEVESIRVVASSRKPNHTARRDAGDSHADGPVTHNRVVFDGREYETPVYHRNALRTGSELAGPALILDPYSTLVVEPGWQVTVHREGAIVLARKNGRTPSKRGEERSEAVALELFTNRFTSIAGEMGEMLRRTALSVNVKERLDFSCALLSASGELIVNAPHIPVHLGAMGLCVRRIQREMEMKPGDVIVTNHPAYGGSHLPDVTVVTPIFSRDRDPRLLGFAASRAHHAEIGGTRPGSMPPDATRLADEGVVIPPTYLIREGREHWETVRRLLNDAPHPTRNIAENIADLQAAIAANQRGVRSMQQLVSNHGVERVVHYMGALKTYAAGRMRKTIADLPQRRFHARELLDDGTPLEAAVTVEPERITFDFEGTGPEHPGNLNATPAIVNSVLIYILRLLVDEPLPLNEGLLEPVTIHLPEGSLLNPRFGDDPEHCPAVVGGNVETSQRLVDLLLKPFERIACSQGTMNNVLFGSDSFGYYETIGGGTGAGPGFGGSDAVHHHMTNTAGTDPEILEQRYPVRLEQYAVRNGSGGEGRWRGGDGIKRELTFLEPVSLSVLTQHRTVSPYGLRGGAPGARGRQWITRNGEATEELASIDGAELRAGDRFTILTPGGGGFGEKSR